MFRPIALSGTLDKQCCTMHTLYNEIILKLRHFDTNAGPFRPAKKLDHDAYIYFCLPTDVLIWIVDSHVCSFCRLKEEFNTFI